MNYLGYNVLYIDNNPLYFDLIGPYLEKNKFHTSMVQGVDNGLDILRQNSFDLVILGLTMDRDKDFELLKEITSHNQDLPVLVFSSTDKAKNVVQTLHSGAWDFIIKSHDNLPCLIEAVSKAFTKRDSLHQEKQRKNRLRKAFKKSEFHRKQLKSIYNSLPDGLMTINRDYNIIMFNQSMKTMCPLGEKLTIGKSIRELSKECQYCFKFIEKTLDEKKEVLNSRVKCPFTQSEFGEQTHLVNTLILKNKSGHVNGVNLIVEDISHQEELEEQFQRRKDFKNIIGKSKQMQNIYNLINLLSKVETTVLISGESGTGKECVVEALHYSGSRAKRPLYKVNCSALSEQLLDSELFGHVRGAFTGAYKDRVGRFEAAHGGTVFLDEIGEISPQIQLKLLRVLETKEFERVGSTNTKKTDVRIISATNENLHKKVEEGLFRKDLYFRLKVMQIIVPPLRDRREDIPLLVQHFCHLFSQKMNKKIFGVSQEVMNLFMAYSWPGNVRELKHAIEHGCVLCPCGKIDIEHLPMELIEIDNEWHFSKSSELHNELTKENIEQVLIETDGNKSKAASMLGVHRKTLYRKMGKLGISLDHATN